MTPPGVDPSEPVTREPAGRRPPSVPPPSVPPASLQPASVPPPSVPPPSVPPPSVPPPSVPPASLQPASDPPPSGPPTSLQPAALQPTARTQVRRHRDRASYELAAVHAILDEGMICHLAASVDGVPWMIPTAYGRDGDVLYLHGAAANHLIAAAVAAGDVVVTVSLLDGIVLARSTFNHSFNYRSVVVFGPAEEVTDPAAKAHGLEVIVDHLLPGRSREARPPTGIELRKTSVLRLPVTEASAKVRTGPPVDDEADLGLPVWAGVLPLRTVAGAPEPDPANHPGLAPPAGLVQPGRWPSPQ